MSYEHLQTRFVPSMPEPSVIHEMTFDTNRGELWVRVRRIGSDMWETIEDTPEVRVGSILVRDFSRDVSDRHPFVTIWEHGLHSAIRQQAGGVPSFRDNELRHFTLSVEMITELCLSARALHLMDFSKMATWHVFVREIADDLGEGLKSELKLDAQDFLDFGSTPHDSVDRLNGPNRLQVLNTAIRRLEERIDILYYLLGVSYNRRVLELFALYDRIWEIRTRVMCELNALQFQFERLDRITSEWVKAAVERMEICMAMLETVYVAPYGTNSFKYTSEETAEIVQALCDERFDDAQFLWDTAYRSLSMLGLQRELEFRLRVVFGYNNQDMVPTDMEQGYFARAMANRRDFLRQNPEIDVGFNDRIAVDLANHLDDVVEAAVGRHWNGDGVYEALGAACACFGRRKHT